MTGSHSERQRRISCHSRILANARFDRDGFPTKREPSQAQENDSEALSHRTPSIGLGIQNAKPGYHNIRDCRTCAGKDKPSAKMALGLHQELRLVKEYLTLSLFPVG